MQTNLYDFLRRLQRDSSGQPGAITLTSDEKGWLDQFLQNPGVELHFKAFPTGELSNGEPLMAQNYQLAGDAEEIFCLLTEAAMQNPYFNTVLTHATRYMAQHVPNCEYCLGRVLHAQLDILDHPSWEFSPHPTTQPPNHEQY